MKTMTSSKIKQSLGDALAAAALEPVAITRHGKTRFVLMSVEEFERRPAPYPRAYSVHDTPDDLRDAILDALGSQIAGQDAGPG
ncbi:MAG: type II toxin-antitoxin system Phd/YefM family antitoxin [Paracoccaceae bacterium]